MAATGLFTGAALIHAGQNLSLIIVLLALYGGVIFSQYPLGLSYAADRASTPEATVQLNRGLLLCNGIGTASGPVLTGLLVPFLGPASLFGLAVTVNLILIGTTAWRSVRDPPISADQASSFVPFAETTPAALEIDPRLEPAPS